MMMRNIWSILCLLSAVAAFQPITMRPGMATTTARYMFNADDKKPDAVKPLEEVSPLEEVNAADSVMASTDESTTVTEKSKNYYKNMNTGEIKEVEWVRTDPSWFCRRPTPRLVPRNRLFFDGDHDSLTSVLALTLFFFEIFHVTE